MRSEKYFHFCSSIHPFCFVATNLSPAPTCSRSLGWHLIHRKFLLPLSTPKPVWFYYIMASTGFAFLFLRFFFFRLYSLSFLFNVQLDSASAEFSFSYLYSYEATREPMLVNIASSSRPFRFAVIKPKRRGCTCARAWCILNGALISSADCPTYRVDLRESMQRKRTLSAWERISKNKLMSHVDWRKWMGEEPFLFPFGLCQE